MSIERYETPDKMTNAEAVLLCRFAKACCPQQAIDQYTPDAWHELLRDLTFEDCKQAIIHIVKTQPFIAPAEIRDRVRAIRIDREQLFRRRFIVERPIGYEAVDEIEWERALTEGLRDGTITEPAHAPPGGTFYDRMGELAPLPPAPGSQKSRAPKGLLAELRRMSKEADAAKTTSDHPAARAARRGDNHE